MCAEVLVRNFPYLMIVVLVAWFGFIDIHSSWLLHYNFRGRNDHESEKQPETPWDPEWVTEWDSFWRHAGHSCHILPTRSSLPFKENNKHESAVPNKTKKVCKRNFNDCVGCSAGLGLVRLKRSNHTSYQPTPCDKKDFAAWRCGSVMQQ